MLVATGRGGAGLDIDDVDAVFNFDVPEGNEYYIHRIGRTGRAKRHGAAFSLVANVAEGTPDGRDCAQHEIGNRAGGHRPEGRLKPVPTKK